MTPEKHQKAIQVIVDTIHSKDFSNWWGIPGKCPIQALIASFPPASEGIGDGYLGKDMVFADFRMLTAHGYQEPLKVWYKHGYVLRIDNDYPEINSALPDLLNALGEVDARMDTYWDFQKISGSEWVWPQRGLSLYIRPESQMLLHLALYRPVTMKAYKKKFRLHMRIREFPSPGMDG